MSERSRLALGLGGIVVVLAVVNVSRSAVIPAGWHFAVNVALAGAVLAAGLALGLRRDELGMDPAQFGSGMRWGGAAALIVVAAVAVAAVMPMLADAFDDGRADLGFGGLLLKAAVVIPVGTVVVEEVIFRGVVFGLLLRLTSSRWAIVVSSVVFGLWHVYPASRGGGDNALVDDVNRSLAVAGTLAATILAGVVFAWLRVRSRSLLAPSLAHIATNSTPLVAAWIVSQ